MKYFVGIVPPEEIFKKVLNIQQKFGDNRLEPHITLRPPVTVTNTPGWMEAIKEVCSIFTPIRIHLHGTGNFGNRVLFISVLAETLGNLHYAITEAIKPYEQKEEKKQENQIYHPHLTLGRQWCGFTKDDFEKMKELADEFLIGKHVFFTADTIRIYHKPFQHSRYQPLEDISLSQKTNKL